MAFLSSKKLWAFSFPLLNKSPMQEFCAYLHQGNSIFQSNTNSVYFSLRLVCVDKRKKLKKSPLQKSTKIDAHTLHTTQPKKFQKWKILSSKWRENTGFIQVCTKTKATPPQSEKTMPIRIEQGNDRARVSPCRIEGCESMRKLYTPEPPKATPAPPPHPKHLIHASTVPWKGRSFTPLPPQRDGQSFFRLILNQEDEEHTINPC